MKGVSVVAEAMSTFLSNIGVFFTQSMSWAYSALYTITSSPALTVMCLGMPIVGFAVGLLSRLFRTN